MGLKMTPKNNCNMNRRKIATLDDFSSKDKDNEHDDEDQGQDYFAGGEKSGVLVHGGGQRPGGNASDLVKDILSKAAKYVTFAWQWPSHVSVLINNILHQVWAAARRSFILISIKSQKAGIWRFRI